MLYKVYASTLAQRLKVELKKKKIIPHNQTDFRRGMGMVDNIYSYICAKLCGE